MAYHSTYINPIISEISEMAVMAGHCENGLAITVNRWRNEAKYANLKISPK